MIPASLRPPLIAAAVAGTLFLALLYAEASTPELDFGATKYVMPMVLFSGILAGLRARAGNRRVPVAGDARKADLLRFAPVAGQGWVAVLRDRANAAGQIGFDLSVDGAVVAQLLPKRFALVPLPVGRHNLFADFPGVAGPSAVAPLDVEIREGALLLFAIRSSMGLTRTSLRLEPIEDTPRARATLARMGLVEPEAARR